MVYRIFGRSGYGKSEYLYKSMKKIMSENPGGQFDIILITPEQETVTVERRIIDKFGNVSNLRIEVLNFSRMSNRVSRELGGMIYDYADSTLKKLIMNNVLKLLEPALVFYGKVYDNMDFVDAMTRITDEFKLWSVTPQMLEEASKKMGGSEIAEKINEISAIYAAYNASFAENLHDMSDEMNYLSDLLDNTRISNSENSGSGKKYFFSDKYVFIDSFDSFTHGQKLVLSKIFRQARDVYITIKIADKSSVNKSADFEEGSVFYRPADTSKFIAELCDRFSLNCKDIFLTEPRRFKNAVIMDLEKRLWKKDRLWDYTGADFKDKLEIYECESIFNEAETAAKKILYLVREKKYKFRDIKIAASDISLYAGILDSVFERYDIPLFMSKRTKLSAKPLISMILSLFDIAVYDFRLPHVQSYIKNGLCSLDLDEIDDFELYITSWQLNGAYRYAQKDWNMHPDGYVEYSEEDEHIKSYLERINQIRRKFAVPIIGFIEKLRDFADKKIYTVKNITTAVISFLDEQNIYDKLTELQSEQQKNGDYDEAAETAQIWNTLMDLFHKIVLANGNDITDLKKYSELFKFILDDIDIGKIPTSIDEVSAQSADLMRDGDTKCTIILGVNSDVFPKAITDGGLFSDSEKAVLEHHGIKFSEDSLQQSFDQLYYFYNAATSSSECLIMTYTKANAKGESMSRSMLIEKVLDIFPNLEIYNPKKIELFNIEGRENGLLELNLTENSSLKAALVQYFGDEAEKSSAGFKEQDIFIDKKMADKLFYNQTMSSTKLESYVKCHFGYFCNYVIGLKAPKRPAMQLTDIGKFIHKILELFMLRICDDKLDFRLIDDNFVKEICEELIKTYLDSVIKDYEYKSERFKYLLKRLNKIIFEIIKNLREEFLSCDFVPRDFELGINDTGGDNSIKPARIEIPGRGVLKITGIVDRVDVYKRGSSTYIRIVDYKTGSKKFNFSDILIGLNLQMLIYLFSVWNNGERRYGGDTADTTTAETAARRSVVPAGVLYMPSKISPYEKTPDMTDEDISKLKDKNFERSGIFLQDQSILAAMENNLEGRFIPVNLNAKSGAISFNNRNGGSAVLASLEQIGRLERYVTRTLSNIASELARGNASVKPFKGKGDSCAFCEMSSVCRFENGDAHKKTPPSLRQDKVWEVVEGELN